MKANYLDEVRQREQAATPGPWKFESWSGKISNYEDFRIATFDGGYGPNMAEQKLDAEFTTHARTDIPKLLSLIESLEREVSVLREGCIKITDFTGGCYSLKIEANKAIAEADKIRESRGK